MDKQQREEVLTQIEMFLGIGLLFLLVAAIYWGGNAQAGWGTMTDWIGRGISSLMIIVAIPFLLRNRKGAWFIVLAVLAATAALWVIFAIASIGFSYGVFIGISVLFSVYSILLGIYYLWSGQTGRVSEWLDKMINTAVFARQMVWSALLLVGTITTWSDIRNHVKGCWPDIVLIVGLLLVLLLMYGWIRGVWQDRRQDFRDHPE